MNSATLQSMQQLAHYSSIVSEIFVEVEIDSICCDCKFF